MIIITDKVLVDDKDKKKIQYSNNRGIPKHNGGTERFELRRIKTYNKTQ